MFRNGVARNLLGLVSIDDEWVLVQWFREV